MTEADHVAPMIFFNIGWMTNYLGAVSDDLTLGGHGHLKTSTHGGEAYNFVPFEGRFLGYRPTGEKGINIRRLGASPKDESISGVTVVWMARRPNSQDTVVVGWYRNATVHRNVQTAPVAPHTREWPEYMVDAAIEDCRLLPVTARNFQILSAHRVDGGFGQSPTYYDALDLYRTKVAAYIDNVDDNVSLAKRKGRQGGPRNTNPALRRQVEETAIKHATTYYESEEGGAWEVESVEAHARGWDLECRRDDKVLYVEVKGCSGNAVRAELTPNEWSKMNDLNYRSTYVLYVVTDCLSDAPLASIFQYETKHGWQTMDGRSLKIEERMAARVSC
ncbi:DUF3883 domain-containing protein [Sphingobium sp. DN12]|uniref:DUF3883 domain-containing protein n=1 Tax=Sphingobium sp. DN12 TaxID=3378073 RepID=UPI003DA5F7C3